MPFTWILPPQLSLVLICRWTTCDVATSTAWDTFLTYENMCCRQQQPSQAFTADVPAKLNSSQLRRLAGVRACDRCCCRRRMFSYQNSIPGSTGGYVASSLAAYENQALGVKPRGLMCNQWAGRGVVIWGDKLTAVDKTYMKSLFNQNVFFNIWISILRSIFTSLFGAEANKKALEQAKKHK